MKSRLLKECDQPDHAADLCGLIGLIMYARNSAEDLGCEDVVSVLQQAEDAARKQQSDSCKLT